MAQKNGHGLLYFGVITVTLIVTYMDNWTMYVLSTTR